MRGINVPVSKPIVFHLTECEFQVALIHNKLLLCKTIQCLCKCKSIDFYLITNI